MILNIKLLTETTLTTAKLSGSGLQRKPVDPSTTVSVGPPSLTAITGSSQYIASIGPMPKCSAERSLSYIFTLFALFLSLPNSRSEHTNFQSRGTASTHVILVPCHIFDRHIIDESFLTNTFVQQANFLPK